MKVEITENVYLSDGCCVTANDIKESGCMVEVNIEDGKVVPIIYAPKGAIGEWDEDEEAVFTEEGGEYHIPESLIKKI